MLYDAPENLFLPFAALDGTPIAPIIFASQNMLANS